MFVEKNERGNIVFYQSERKNRSWGFVNEERNYITMREVKKGQVFYHFKNAIAVQLELLEWLEEHDCQDIRVRIPDFEKEPFWAVISVRDFRMAAHMEFGDKAVFSYDKKDYGPYGKQIRVPLNSFVREYDSQEKLNEVMGK